ncbi:MAG: hypothetical protein KDG52_17485 [Rhodocyclaceae bacterium]|nr:hypothetical protein [Rhodocyclaceae bacterium]
MFRLDEVVPWGRSFDEYRRMFALDERGRELRILGCGDGPAAFNAEATRRGWQVISCDPIYRFDGDALRARIIATRDEVLRQTRDNAGQFVWHTIRSIEELARVRQAAMDAFLADYGEGRAAGRYREAALPRLPFADGSFDLALCSHLLFLYSGQLDLAFHLAAVRELYRVAGELRIFPLLDLDGRPSPWLQPLSDALAGDGFAVSIETVPYEFQRGANRMMRILPGTAAGRRRDTSPRGGRTSSL